MKVKSYYVTLKRLSNGNLILFPNRKLFTETDLEYIIESYIGTIEKYSKTEFLLIKLEIWK